MFNLVSTCIGIRTYVSLHIYACICSCKDTYIRMPVHLHLHLSIHFCVSSTFPLAVHPHVQVFEGPAGPVQQEKLVAVLLLEGIESGPLHITVHVQVCGTLTLHAKDASGTARHNVCAPV
jgi:hypothetical protein